MAVLPYKTLRGVCRVNAVRWLGQITPIMIFSQSSRSELQKVKQWRLITTLAVPLFRGHPITGIWSLPTRLYLIWLTLTLDRSPNSFGMNGILLFGPPMGVVSH